MTKTYTIKLKPLCVVTISVFVLLFSCSKQTKVFEKDLQVFEQRGWKGITKYNFEIDKKGTYKTGNDSNFFLRAIKKDTTIILEYLKSNGTPYPPNFHKIIRLKKTDDTLELYRVISLKKIDTLYDYSIFSKNNNYFDIKKMVFNSGKYYFLNERMKYSNGQQKYYEKHKDSLNEVKGNELPQLPEL